MKKILMITGSYPPDVCGVGDYTKKLFETLENKVDVFYSNDWKLKKFFSLKRKIFQKKYEIYHFQYPTMGYMWILLPQIFCLIYGKKIILTLHEYSNRTLKAKLATTLFFFSKVYIIFTTSEEREYAIKFFPNLKKRSEVINIASNILFLQEKEYKNYNFGYFGLLMPNKGIEEYIEFLGKYQLFEKSYIMGKMVKGFESYFNELSNKCKNKNIEFKIDHDEYEVANVLSETKVMVLLYPDGVSFRRGSFLASIGNSCEIITKKGRVLDHKIDSISYDITDIDKKKILEILDGRKKKNIEKLREEILKELSWEKVMEKHIEVYNSFEKELS